MRKFLMEGIGTFILVIFVILVHNNNSGNFPPLAYGAILVALSYAGVAISGAHYNPSISLAVLITGKLERWDFPYYLIAQIIGALLAGVFAAFLIRCSGNADIALPKYEPICAIFAEALGTFLITLVFLNVSIHTSGNHNAAFGLAVGLAAAAGVYALGSQTTATFNPVIVLGMIITGMCAWADIWASLLGTLIGAAAAVSAFKILHTPREP